jgi:murein L,D-transpeptidase YcbB/YkuD
VRNIAIVVAALFCGQLGSGQVATSASKKSAAAKSATPKTTATKTAVSKTTTTKAAPVAASSKAAPKAAPRTATKAVTAKSTPTATKSTAVPTSARVASNKKAPPRRVLPPPRYLQQQPTTDRYREIQEALAARGYFRGSADGAWGSESADALKRFQADQNLEPDGKIGSLSLIALGLGPRHEGSPARAASSMDHGAEASQAERPDAAQ